MQLKDIIKYLSNIFESKRKNAVSLPNDTALSSNLKKIKIGDEDTPVEISTSEVRVKGTINADAINVGGSAVSTEPDDDSAVITSLNNATANELVTVGATTTELDAESQLTFDSNTLTMGTGADNAISVKTHTTPRDLTISAGNASGINIAGADLIFNAGRQTGSVNGGTILFTTGAKEQASGSNLNSVHNLFYITGQGLATLYNPDAGTNAKFRIDHDGTTMLQLEGTDTESYVRSVTGNLVLISDDDTVVEMAGWTGSAFIVFATFQQSDSSFVLHETDTTSGAKQFKITCGANGATTISTANTTANVADITIAPTGRLTLDSSGLAAGLAIKCESNLILKEIADAVADVAGYGQIWVHDTTPSALMYTDDVGNDYEIGPSAGTILGYTRLQGDLTNSNSFEIQNAITVEDDTHQISFNTPPSELVEIEAIFTINAVSTDSRVTVGLSDANATSGYNSVSAELEYDTTGITFTDDEVDDQVCVVKFVLSSGHLASIGSSNTFWIGFGTAGVTKTVYLAYGLRSSHGLAEHPFIIKATALPRTIYDGQ